MDVQFVDEDGNSGLTCQHFEMEKVIEYAENWAMISNNKTDTQTVLTITNHMKDLIKQWKTINNDK